jgi:outer membrane protein assembly factor BamB
LALAAPFLGASVPKIAIIFGKAHPKSELDPSIATDEAIMNCCKTGLALLIVIALVGAPIKASAADWPRFRGPNGTGIATDKDIPAKWSPENFLFKVEIPGKGHSSPIISKGKIFLQSSSADSKERYLICLDANTGKMIWTRSVPGGPAKTHAKNSLSSCTPAADGERIYSVSWDGSSLMLTAYDYQGELKWKQDLGTFTSQHGPGMAPVVVGGIVVVNKDQDGAAELLTFDAKTGAPGWSKKRDPERACYSTPFLLEKTDAGPDLIVASTGGITAYDPKDGAEIWHFVWKFDKMRLRTVGSPIYHEGMIYAIAGDGAGDRNMIAVKAEGKGNVSGTNLVWQKKKGTAYVPTPLAKDGMLFWIDDKVNVAICADAKTGQEIWNERLGEGAVSASPVMIDGKVYVFTERGMGFVFAAAKEFELLAKNDLKEQVFASPAVADGRLYVRGDKHLFCIGTKK